MTKLGKFATKIKLELKKLPAQMQGEMVEKHGLQVMKAMLEIKKEPERMPKWINLEKKHGKS